MQKISIKLILFSIVMSLLLIIYVGSRLPDGKTLTIIFCDVGQGDAAYLRFPNGRDMLIDGGPDGSVLRCLGRYMPFWDRAVDILLLTHPDIDHFGGLAHVVARYNVGTILQTRVDNNAPEYQEFLRLVDSRRVPEQYLVRGDALSVDSVIFSWFWQSSEFAQRIQANPTLDNPPLGIDRNDTSQVVHVRYGQFDVFFAGDATVEVLPNYIGMPFADVVEILKVPHHGSQNGINRDFLLWLKPQIAVISCGRRNWYGHPHKHILSLLEEFHVAIKRTDIDRDIIVKTDGKTYTIE